MTPLLFPRLFSAGGKRSYSFLASSSAASSKKATRLRLPEILILSSNAAQQHQYDKSFSRPIATESICRLFSTSSSPSFLLLTSTVTYRKFSKYASVDHSSAYTDAIHSAHGRQLQLALEEGRGKDDAPFDPFSAFLDQMGQTDDADDGNNENGNRDGDGNEIEEAEFEEYDNQEEEYDDNNENQPRYDTTGAPHRPKSERLALRAGYPAGGTFAVISLAGFQHKVTKDDLLVVNKLKPVSCWSVGSTHTIKGDDVLLIANQHKTCVGLPGVAGAEVDVMVEEITRDKTLIVFKKRRRKNSRRKNGFRRQVTFLRVLEMRMPVGGVAVAEGIENESMAA